MMIPALIEMSPVGGIPGVPTALALLILLFSLQMLAGRRRLWLPDTIGCARVPVKAIYNFTKAARPVTRRLDKLFYGRWACLTRQPYVRIAAAVCAMLTLTVIPLEFIPFASTAPMAAIASVGVAVMVGDGVVLVFAFIITFVSVAGGIAWVL